MLVDALRLGSDNVGTQSGIPSEITYFPNLTSIHFCESRLTDSDEEDENDSDSDSDDDDKWDSEGNKDKDEDKDEDEDEVEGSNNNLIF